MDPFVGSAVAEVTGSTPIERLTCYNGSQSTAEVVICNEVIVMFNGDL